MLRLLMQAVNPRLGLEKCIANWFDISMQLREHHRRRRLQCEATRDLAVSILS